MIDNTLLFIHMKLIVFLIFLTQKMDTPNFDKHLKTSTLEKLRTLHAKIIENIYGSTKIG